MSILLEPSGNVTIASAKDGATNSSRSSSSSQQPQQVSSNVGSGLMRQPKPMPCYKPHTAPPTRNDDTLEDVAARLKKKTDRASLVELQRTLALIRERDASYRSEKGLILKEFYETQSMNTLVVDGVERYPWVYGKLLEHDSSTLSPSKDDVDKIIMFLANPTESGLANLPLAAGSVRKHEDIVGGYAVEAQNIDALGGVFADIVRAKYIKANTENGFAEMMEVYAMAMLRDNSFSGWEQDSEVGDVINRLEAVRTKFPSSNIPGNVTARSIFRGVAGDELAGGFVSQLLLSPVKAGAVTTEQRYVVEIDSTTTRSREGFKDMVEGKIPGGTNVPDPPIVAYCHNMRVLASVVHNDPAFHIYHNAALVLAGKVGLDALNTSQIHSSNFLDTGGPDLLSTIGAVTRAALRAAWAVKWASGLKVRPETYAAHIDTVRQEHYTNEHTAFSLLHDLVTNDDSGIIDQIGMKNEMEIGENNALLSLVYPEGAPTHPAFPAGHATVAGACVTILKMFLKTHAKDGSKVKWFDVFGSKFVTIDGTELTESQEDAGETIVGELNKLASNVALARNMAGVHYRCDGDCGLLIGEKVAEEYMRSQVKFYYPELLRPHIKFTYENFNKELCVITAR